MPHDPKQQLRAYIKQQRRALTDTQRRLAAEHVATHVIASSLYQQSQRIALYHAVNGELDPAPIAQHALQNGKRIFLPVLSTNIELRFAPLTTTTQWQSNRYGIPEPKTTPAEQLPATQLDLICLPLLAFDTYGNRLGMGGGYYDRTLAFRCNQWQPPPYCMGLAYAFQQRTQLNAESWDVPLDCIATEQGLYFPPATAITIERNEK